MLKIKHKCSRISYENSIVVCFPTWWFKWDTMQERYLPENFSVQLEAGRTRILEKIWIFQLYEFISTVDTRMMGVSKVSEHVFRRVRRVMLKANDCQPPREASRTTYLARTSVRTWILGFTRHCNGYDTGFIICPACVHRHLRQTPTGLLRPGLLGRKSPLF